MITIRHNFDETKFKWLWAKYVKAGNIEKHCTACMTGPYSKKFSGSSNHDLLSQETMVMDEVPEGMYEAIYFCGVLKKGYLHKDPMKNNYPHNVHFAVRPQKGAHDVYDFENWHVEIDGGVLERIPETYELKEKFFNAPYTSHFYTCRIFRWMVGHFYPNELIDVTYGYPEKIHDDGNDMDFNLSDLFRQIRQNGYNYAKDRFTAYEDDETYFVDSVEEYRDLHPGVVKRVKDSRRFMFDHGLFNRTEYAERLSESAKAGGAEFMEFAHCIEFVHDGKKIGFDEERFLWPLFEIGIEDYLDTVATYQQRRFIPIERFDDVN